MARSLLMERLKEIAHTMNTKHTTPVDPTATFQAVVNAAALLQQFTTVRDGQMFVLVPMTGLVKDGVPSVPQPRTLTPAAAATLAEVKAHATGRPTNRATAHDVVAFTPRKTRGKQERKFGRARYFTKLHGHTKVEKLELADRQRDVFAFIHKAGKKGVTARQVEKHLGKGDRRKGHGPFSSTKQWLIDHGLIEAREDMFTTNGRTRMSKAS